MKRVVSCFFLFICCWVFTCGPVVANKTEKPAAVAEEKTEKQEDSKNIFRFIGDFFQKLKDDVSKGFRAKNETGTLTVPRTDITNTRTR